MTFVFDNADVQTAAFANGGTGINPFPRTGSESTFNPPLPKLAQFGATEVKASWRVLRPGVDDFSRYYTQTGYYVQPDGTTCEGPVTFGLVGLHILRLTPSTPWRKPLPPMSPAPCARTSAWATSPRSSSFLSRSS